MDADFRRAVIVSCRVISLCIPSCIHVQEQSYPRMCVGFVWGGVCNHHLIRFACVCMQRSNVSVNSEIRLSTGNSGLREIVCIPFWFLRFSNNFGFRGILILIVFFIFILVLFSISFCLRELTKRHFI